MLSVILFKKSSKLCLSIKVKESKSIGASIFLIYEAPLILTEAAFEFVLAGVLIKQARAIDNPNWVGSIFKNTWKPFVCTLAIACCIAYVLSNIFPEASKLTDIL